MRSVSAESQGLPAGLSSVCAAGVRVCVISRGTLTAPYGAREGGLLHFARYEAFFCMAQDFKRVGDDLLYTAKITLIQSLTGHTFDLRTLDGRLLHVPLDTVVHPK